MTFNVAIIPRDVGFIYFEDKPLAEKVQSAYSRHLVFDVALKGKHSKGSAVAYSPEEDMAWLLKPGFGKNSPALGVNDTDVSQSRREVAFPKIGRRFVSEGSFLGTGLLTLDGVEVSCMDLLPVTFMNIQKAKKQASLADLFKPYYESGEVWKWSFLDYVLGNPDRHGGNVLVDIDSGRIVLIDHSSAFAGPNFNPGNDENSFVPYYLRFNAPANYQTLSPAEKYKLLPVPTAQEEKNFKHWLDSFDKATFIHEIGKYGIPTDAIRSRFQSIASATDPLKKLNRMWTGTEVSAALAKNEGGAIPFYAIGSDADDTEADYWLWGKHSPGYKVAQKLGYGQSEMGRQLTTGKMPEEVKLMLLHSGDPDMAHAILGYEPREDYIEAYLKGMADNSLDHLNRGRHAQETALVAGVKAYNSMVDRKRVMDPQNVKFLGDELLSKVYDQVTQPDIRHTLVGNLFGNSKLDPNGYPIILGNHDLHDKIWKDFEREGKLDKLLTSTSWLNTWIRHGDADRVARIAVEQPTYLDRSLGGANASPEFRQRIAAKMLPHTADIVNRSGDMGLMNVIAQLSGKDAAEWYKHALPEHRRAFDEIVTPRLSTKDYHDAISINPEIENHAFFRINEVPPEKKSTVINNMLDSEGVLTKSQAFARYMGIHDTQKPSHGDLMNRLRDVFTLADPKHSRELLEHLDIHDVDIMNAAEDSITASGVPDAGRPTVKFPPDVQQLIAKRFRQTLDDNRNGEPSAQYRNAAMRSLTNRFFNIFETGMEPRALTPDLLTRLNEPMDENASPSYGNENFKRRMTNDILGDIVSQDPEHGKVLINAMAQHIAKTGEDFFDVLAPQRHGRGFHPYTSHITPETMAAIQASPHIERMPHLARLVQEHNPPEVNFAVGSGKMRKVRQHALFHEQNHGRKIHRDELKALGYDLGAMKLGHLLDAKGQLSHAAIDKAVEALPKSKLNILHGLWEGAQRHSHEPSKVMKFLATPEHMAQMQAAGVDHVFQRLNQWSSGGHPTHPGRGIGWLRYTEGENGHHIDEIQTDFGPNLIAQLKQMEAGGGDREASMLASRARENGITSKAVKTINDILYGEHKPDRVFHEAFLQHLRDTGHVGKRIHIWDSKSKADMNLEPGKGIPGHYLNTYGDTPKKLGYAPSKYGELKTQSNSEHKDKATWGDSLVKSENHDGSGYPMAGTHTDGLEVHHDEIHNTQSIPATFTKYKVHKGIREVPLDHFHSSPHDLFYSASDHKQAHELADHIKNNGYITPLIVAMDHEGPYILEGAHRLAALHILGKKSFPALVVHDQSNLKDEQES
jgi:hypothetical protein